MKIKVLICIYLMSGHFLHAQTGMVEHYYYVSRQNIPATVPMAHYTTAKNWYGEVRYNYEDINTVSVYAGKTFSSGDDEWSYSATPMIGGLMGTMQGGAAGANIDVSYGKLFFSTQSQYAFSMRDKMNKYFFSWSEIGVEALPWLYGGLALQQTNPYREKGAMEGGCTIGLMIKNWTIPLYIFNPFENENKFFIVGVNWEWQNSSQTK
jgi:hypothetical protein